MNSARKKFYLTTAIDYVNDKPHLGHALEKIQADVLARHHRLKGEDVRFLTGTDEHGVKISRAAQAAGKAPRELADGNAEKFRGLKEALNLSWDDFIRTTDRNRHWPGAEKLWLKIKEAGDLYKKTYRGWYCVGHEAFVTEKDLAGGLCRDHQTKPEKISEENWFFRLSEYAGEIERRIDSDELRVIPASRKNEILSFIRGGLEDVSFSRPRKDLSWGIPVPDDESQTIYVWGDALANYITAIGYGGDEAAFRQWWPAELHVIGKDILRFHAAIWPGMLLSAGLALPQAIFVHGFITVDGQKMSKTIGNVVDPTELVKKYGVDAVRYYLLRDVPSYEDGDFSIRKFEECYNGELANGPGNLVARVAALGEKISPVRFDAAREIIPEIKKKIEAISRNYETALAEIRLNEALSEVWQLIGFADRYINDTKPWAASGAAELKKIVVNAGYLISALSDFLRPFLPETADKITRQILLQGDVMEIKKGENLFPRLGL